MTDDLQDRVPDLEREADALERRAAALRQIVAGLKALDANGNGSGIAAKSTNGHRPTNQYADGQLRGQDAVRAVVIQRPGKWTVREIITAAKRQGSPSPVKALEHAVHRLSARGELKRIGNGVYRFPGPAIKEVVAS